jgi:SAM-dependent methyltransferase
MFRKRDKVTMAARITVSESRRPFVPGMGVDWLLPIYDPFTRLLGLDVARRDLLLQADLRSGHRILDVGCGTGALTVLAKRLFPQIEVFGLDPDAKALARAARKARRAGANIRFDRGFADALDYPDASFDRVFSSFMFHHLERHEKERMLGEIRRVLRPGGTLHLLDFGGPKAAGRGSRLRSLHGHPRLVDNDERTVLGLLSDAGLADLANASKRVLLGLVRIVYYRAGRSLT